MILLYFNNCEIKYASSSFVNMFIKKYFKIMIFEYFNFLSYKATDEKIFFTD
ncbi:MAG: hypothetical protein ACP5JU_01985 [Minisyncoccia bacterium]